MRKERKLFPVHPCSGHKTLLTSGWKAPQPAVPSKLRTKYRHWPWAQQLNDLSHRGAVPRSTGWAQICPLPSPLATPASPPSRAVHGQPTDTAPPWSLSLLSYFSLDRVLRVPFGQRFLHLWVSCCCSAHTGSCQGSPGPPRCPRPWDLAVAVSLRSGCSFPELLHTRVPLRMRSLLFNFYVSKSSGSL